jgi:aminoglycoside phosphotransferase (APT) family kinase protein
LPDWTAELVVDEELARQLLARFPELEVESVRPFAEGWDYTIWLVNEHWTFRFPRREIVVPGMRREIAVLPELAPLLPIQVPAPVFVGRPDEGFPWPFFGSELLPGRELGEAELDNPTRMEIGRSLGRFLRRLHDAEINYELPADGNRRADMSVRVPKTRKQLEELEAAEGLPPSDVVAVVHGDLHFRQVLVGDDGSPTGVIDWVDVCRSDPAIDLSMLWSYLPRHGRAAFLSEYGRVSDEQLVRARVIALSLSAALAHYGHNEGFSAVEREALSGLTRTAAE